MTQIAAGALLFLRADVRPAAHDRRRDRTPRGAGLREPAAAVVRVARISRPASRWRCPWSTRTRIASLDGPPTASTWESVAAGPILSDTGELSGTARRPSRGW